MNNQAIKEEIKKLKARSGLIAKIEKNEAEIDKLRKALERAEKKQEELLYEFQTGEKPKKEKVSQKGGENE